MRPGDCGLFTRAMAARAWPDAADLGRRRPLAFRSRRQRAVAAGARQRRSADHGPAEVFRFRLSVDIRQSAIRSGVGENGWRSPRTENCLDDAVMPFDADGRRPRKWRRSRFFEAPHGASRGALRRSSMPDIPLNLAEIEQRIAATRENISELVEQAAAYSGAADEELAARRIAEQEAQLELLTRQRDELTRRKSPAGGRRFEMNIKQHMEVIGADGVHIGTD